VERTGSSCELGPVSIGGSLALRLTIGNTTTGRTSSISVAAPPPGPCGWQAFFSVVLRCQGPQF
jgi:hypothetical protein